MSRLDTLIEEQKKKHKPLANADVATLNNITGASAKVIEDDYKAQIAETEKAYVNALDENSVQRIINERQIAESMANSGLTNSGLNRTQMTANQLSYANNQSKIQRQRQAAVDALARAMSSQLTSLESDRAMKEQSIRSGYDSTAISNATSIYNAEQDAAAKKYAADLEAQTEQLKILNQNSQAKVKARSELITALTKRDEAGKYQFIDGSEGFNGPEAKALLQQYFAQYGADDDDYRVLKNLGYDIDGYYGYLTPEKHTQRVDSFKSSLTPISQMQFSCSGVPGAPKDTALYSSYKEYVNEMLEQWIREGKLLEEDVAEIVSLYKLY